MHNDEEHPGETGLPGKQEQNHEQQEPVEPSRRSKGDREGGGGDPESGGGSGEGSQSTGNPDSAG